MSEEQVDRSDFDIRACIKSVEKAERNCRRSGKINKAAMLRKAIAQLKMAQRAQ